MKLKVYAIAALILGLTLITQAANAATDPHAAFDSDARCVVSGMEVTIKTQDDPDGLLNLLITKIYVHRLQAEGKALGYSGPDLQGQMQRALQSFPGYAQFDQSTANLREKALEASFAACKTDLVADIHLPAVAAIAELLRKNYDADTTCLSVYADLPDRDDRSSGFLIGDAPIYLKRFQADADALGKARTQRSEDLQRAHAEVERKANAGFNPGQVMSEADLKTYGDGFFAKAQTCAAALKAAE